ncbi:ABC transporter permease [Amylibacter ulvae]|uniref:ABC transporter permease n=1 Tax=Paramylibacter ulvae TaxID=1651968 RepID=A0ABQ3CXG7_9RHOB|nr:energy-coupling factor transporter transmembrane protein EcfT [Amylibacter ulvae]GHA45907.1 ABC transporter permease [Amylibacter ulvae]
MLSLTLPMQSWAHSIPAWVKLALLVVISFAMFPIRDIAILAVIVGGVTCLYLTLGRMACAQGLKMLKPLAWMMAILLIYHVITGQIGEGIRITLKMFALVGIANFVTMTTRLDDMIAVVMILLAPLKLLGINTRSIALAFAMVIRFTPVLFQKSADIANSWRARSPKRVGWRVVLPLCFVAIDDAEHISEALRARGGVTSDH